MVGGTFKLSYCVLETLNFFPQDCFSSFHSPLEEEDLEENMEEIFSPQLNQVPERILDGHWDFPEEFLHHLDLPLQSGHSRDSGSVQDEQAAIPEAHDDSAVRDFSSGFVQNQQDPLSETHDISAIREFSSLSGPDGHADGKDGVVLQGEVSLASISGSAREEPNASATEAQTAPPTSCWPAAGTGIAPAPRPGFQQHFPDLSWWGQRQTDHGITLFCRIFHSFGRVATICCRVQLRLTKSSFIQCCSTLVLSSGVGFGAENRKASGVDELSLRPQDLRSNHVLKVC